MKASKRTIIVIILYLLAAVWFFFPIGAPQEKSLLFSLRLALPAALLALGGMGFSPWLMTIGFVFCTIGDAMGVLGSFEGQMGGFAVAHFCFIGWFAQQLAKAKEGKKRGFSLLIMSPLCVVPLVIAAVRIIPEIHDTIIRIGCAIFSLLLTGTLWTAWARFASPPPCPQPRRGALLAAVGATLFFASDFILAWNMFVESVPHSRDLIMSTYYAALLLLFIGTPRTLLSTTGNPESNTFRREK